MKHLKKAFLFLTLISTFSAYSQEKLTFAGRKDLKNFNGKFNTYNSNGKATDPVFFTYDPIKEVAVGKTSTGTISCVLFLMASGPDDNNPAINMQEEVDVLTPDKETFQISKRGTEFLATIFSESGDSYEIYTTFEKDLSAKTIKK